MVAEASTFAVATILYAEELSSEGVVIFALVMSLGSTVLVMVVFVCTLCAAATGSLFAPDPVLSVVLEEPS